MSLSQLTSPTAVKMAVAEYDRLGPDLFRRKYGFGSARTYVLTYEGRSYDSKAIAGVAHGYQFPGQGPLTAQEFTGGKLSFDAGGHLSKLGFDIATIERRATDWSLRDCENTADAYFDCLRKKLLGEKFNRQRIIDQVSAQIGRSPGAVDYKFQNIDAILLEAQLPRLGDAVAANAQKLLRYVVLDPLASRFAILLNPTPSRVDEQREDVFVPIPHIDAGNFMRDRDVSSLSATKIDFTRREADNRQIGRSAEEWVFNLEQNRLREAGFVELAEKVKWVSNEDGDGCGYDISSFETDGKPLYIEVKGTNQGESSAFYLTETELAVSEYLGAAYRLYRVFNLSNRPKIYVISGPLSSALNLRPTTYIALPKESD
jgi:hypothetical protein